MAERSQLQYTPIVGPVWREPVADRLAWLPRVQQPARTLPPNRLGDYARPEFAALYRPEGLQWTPSDQYAGRALAYARNDWTVTPPRFAAPAYDPQNLEWIPQGSYPRVPVELRNLGSFAQPPFDALYKPAGLQWIPSERFPGRGLAPNRLGDFEQPAFDALYKPAGIQWIANNPYLSRELARAAFDWSLYPIQPPAAAGYDPSDLAWKVRGEYPGLPRPSGHLDYSVYPPPDALYNPAGIQWAFVNVYRGQAQALARNDWSIYPLQPPAVVAFDPASLSWQQLNPYIGQPLARSAYDYSIYPLQTRPDAVAPAVVAAFTGGWLTYEERREGYEAYVRARRVELGITDEVQEREPEPSSEARDAVSAAANRQAGLRMSAADREADLAREFSGRNIAWRDEYRQALYAELYALEAKSRRATEALILFLAAE